MDHSTAGAREAFALYGPQWGKLLAFVAAGHHAGLADGPDLARGWIPPRQLSAPSTAGGRTPRVGRRGAEWERVRDALRTAALVGAQASFKALGETVDAYQHAAHSSAAG